MMRVLSRLPERSILGLWNGQRISSIVGHAQKASYFSREVARLVTHPECPSKEPRNTSCSDMLCGMWSYYFGSVMINLKLEKIRFVGLGK